MLGSVFAGVYKFVNPTFRSEATVQLAAPAGAQGAELQKWLSQQTEFVRNHEVTDAAWKLLRGTDEKYAMHDGREEWQASLAKSLALQMDPQGKTLAIRYSGQDGLGVSQVCNALATALTNPQLRETSEQTKAIGAGSTVLAKATASLYPADDNRLMLSLSVVAGVLMVSLVLVIMFRHYVARQLQEIDQMADEADLADIKGELPAEASGG